MEDTSRPWAFLVSFGGESHFHTLFSRLSHNSSFKTTSELRESTTNFSVSNFRFAASAHIHTGCRKRWNTPHSSGTSVNPTYPSKCKASSCSINVNKTRSRLITLFIRICQSDKSKHRSVVNTVALWDSWLTRRPFSRWTLLPIVDTKKKIETSETFLTTSTHFPPR